MNIITFKYTKADGKETFRTLAPSVVPNRMYEGTDISELEGVDQVMYAQALSKLKDEFAQKVLELNNEFDVNKRYRCFDPTKMTNIIHQSV